MFFKHYNETVMETCVKVKLMKQIISGLAFLHNKDIVHRDIKPTNILLKSTRGKHAIAKLEGFGLSKIFEAVGMTSAMSSQVGTHRFKAPEFFNRGPDNKVRYHRNVDVYAVGLTFAAMLQAQSGSQLVPKVEGSLQDSETRIGIGFVAMRERSMDSQIYKSLKTILKIIPPKNN